MQLKAESAIYRSSKKRPVRWSLPLSNSDDTGKASQLVGNRLTKHCSRLPTASAPASLPLSAAAECQRSAVPTKRAGIMPQLQQQGVLRPLERNCDDQTHLCSSSASHPVPA